MLSILSNPGEKQRYSNLNPGDVPRTGASAYNTLHQADAVNHVYGGGARVNGLIRLPAARLVSFYSWSDDFSLNCNNCLNVI